MKKIALHIILCCIFTQLSAQEKWSFEECVAYALDNNLNVRQ